MVHEIRKELVIERGDFHFHIADWTDKVLLIAHGEKATFFSIELNADELVALRDTVADIILERHLDAYFPNVEVEK